MDPVARDASEEVGAVHFKRAARGIDVLVIVFSARGQVGPETVAGQAGERAANPDDAGAVDRGRGSDDAIGLVVAAIGAAHLQAEIVGQALGHILDRAAHGVAAIERALRTAQNFDAFDVIDVEHRTLRAVEVHVVEVDADALFKARNRILLANAADEGRKGGVGAAAGFQRHVGHLFCQRGDVHRAGVGKLVAGQGGDGDRHVDQRFLAATGGDDDLARIALGRCFGILSMNRRGGEADECACDQRSAAQQGSLTHGYNPSQLNPSRTALSRAPSIGLYKS